MVKTARAFLVFQCSSGPFYLVKEANPFSPDLVAFVRIFTADLHTLQLFKAGTTQLESKLKSTEWHPRDNKVFEFLENRYDLHYTIIMQILFLK